MQTLTRRAAVVLAILVTSVMGIPTSLAAAPDMPGPAAGNVAAPEPTATASTHWPALISLGELLPGVRTATAARDAEALTNAIIAAEAHAQVEAAAAAQAAAEAEAAAAAQAAPGWPWDQLVQCEAGGNWAANTGNGFSGGLQFVHSTWAAYGGQTYASSAHQATAAQQIDVAQRIVDSHGGSYGAWPGCRAKLGLP